MLFENDCNYWKTESDKMKLANKALAILLVLILLSSGVSASKSDDKKSDGNKKIDERNNENTVQSDDGSAEVTEEVAGVTEDGKEKLIKRTVKHFRNNATTRQTSAAATSGCYNLMGGKWTILPVSYVINPTNSQGLSQAFVTSAFSRAAETWDTATTKELFRNTYTISTSTTFGAYDGKNTLSFGNKAADTNVIAVTSTWYTSVTKRIVDFDISFETDYRWGDATTNPSKMDLQNIATHELGHGLGLNDLYNSCTQETMYGKSGYGETLKRTLNPGDITGLKAIYG